MFPRKASKAHVDTRIVPTLTLVTQRQAKGHTINGLSPVDSREYSRSKWLAIFHGHDKEVVTLLEFFSEHP
jgi:hypothetical protein